MRIPMAGSEMARLRFAVSPVYETFMAVDVLRSPGAHAIHLPWVRWARPQLAEIPDLALVAAFTAVKPAFLLPVPDARMPTIAEELRRIKSYSPEKVRLFLDLNHPRRGAWMREVYADPPAGLARLAGILRVVHDKLIQPHWPRLVGILEADIAHRAGILADGGAEAVFERLHPDVEWTGGELLLRDDPRRRNPAPLDIVLEGRGLVLSPSAFCWPEVWSATRPTNAGILRYPARGIATLWETRRPTPDALVALLGRTRAELLTQLAAPATTGDLARGLGVTPGAVSQHLGVLRASGLVATRRDGRVVLHLRTDRADALLR